MRLSLSLPFPPSSNTYYRSVRFGKSCRVLLSKRGREYREEVCDFLAKILDDASGFPLLDRLEVHIVIHPPNRRKFDLDNRLKALCDALELAGVFENDEQIDLLIIERGEIIKGGGAEVTIQPLEGRC